MKTYDAVKALILKKDKFLLLRKSSLSGGSWEIPGGRKQKQESDEVALKREVKEETGLSVSIVRFLDNWSLKLPKKT